MNRPHEQTDRPNSLKLFMVFRHDYLSLQKKSDRKYLLWGPLNYNVNQKFKNRQISIFRLLCIDAKQKLIVGFMSVNCQNITKSIANIEKKKFTDWISAGI